MIETIESGIVTKDLAGIAQPPIAKRVTTEGFIDAIAARGWPARWKRDWHCADGARWPPRRLEPERCLIPG